MKHKKYKSLLCTMVFAIVALHALLLHGHHHACGAEAHLHDFSHCEQLDLFEPADPAPDLATLSGIVPELPCRTVPPPLSRPAESLPDKTDAFVASAPPDIGGRGLRAPPAA